MKRLLTLIIGLFCTALVYAECTYGGLWVFPSGQAIKQNSIFVLNGYSLSQQVILDLNKKHNIYLKSGNKKIKLIVTEICVGEFDLTQAILKPETELEAELEYTMQIDNLPQYESFERYNNTTQKYEPVTYKVIAGKDTEKPQLTSRPEELKKTLVHYGCGPTVHVGFSNPAKDESDIIVKTTVRSLKTGKETTYYIEPHDDKIKVGHGMCAGAFEFNDGNNYEIEFSFMDSSGNITTWTGERIKFTSPTEETNHYTE